MSKKFIRKVEADTHLLPEISFSISHTEGEIEALYRGIVEIRAMEEANAKLYEENKIRGFCHLDIGQECVFSALKQVKADQDLLIGSYRCHGLAYVAGCPMSTIFGELMGRCQGVSKGKGGSMHMYGKRFYGGHGIVGSQASIGCGLSFYLNYDRYDKDDIANSNTTFCFLGDGSTNQGQLYESYNISHMLNLPIVFVVMNNCYGMYTPSLSVTPNLNFYCRSDYVPGIRLNGHNGIDIMVALRYARTYSLFEGPIIVQIDCYRYCGHSTVDNFIYRTEEEIEREKKVDCKNYFEMVLNDFDDEEGVKKIRDEADKMVREELEIAEDMAPPADSELYTDVLK